MQSVCNKPGQTGKALPLEEEIVKALERLSLWAPFIEREATRENLPGIQAFMAEWPRLYSDLIEAGETFAELSKCVLVNATGGKRNAALGYFQQLETLLLSHAARLERAEKLLFPWLGFSAPYRANPDLISHD